MRPPRRPSGLGARAVGGFCRLAGLICTLALADEDLGGKGLSCLEARSLDDASLLIQSFPLAGPAASVATEPYLKQASARYLARHKRIVGRRRTRRAGKQAPAAGEPRLAAPAAAAEAEAAGAAEQPKPPGWYEARARELQEAVTRVDNATGQETAEWWEARAKELREARQEVKKLAWQQNRDKQLKALAAEEERRRAKRRDFAAQQEARQAARQAFAERKRRARERAEQEARWKAEDEEAIRELFGAPMNVTVRDGQGKELHFHFRNATKLKVLMVYVAGKLGVKPGEARLTFRGKQLEANATAEDVGLQDHGVVDVDGHLPAEGEAGPYTWEDADLPEPGRLHLVVKNASGREVHVEMLGTARLQLLMGLTCKRLRLEQKEVRFLHNGTQLRSGDTPERIGLADKDVIEVEPDPAYFEALRQAAEEAKQKEEAEQRAKEEAERRARESQERRETAAFAKETRRALQEAQGAARLAVKELALKAQEEAQRQKLQAAEQRRQEQAKASELAAQEEEEKRARFGGLVYLLVRDQQGRELRVKYRTRMPLRALLAVARKKWGLEKGEVSFAHAGAEIRPEATPEALGLKDMDVIDARVAADATAHLVAERKAHLKPRRRPRTSSRHEADRAKKAQDWLVIEPDMDFSA